MKGGIEFFKTTIIGGLVVLIPIVVVIVVIGSALGLLIDFTDFISDNLPPEYDLTPLETILIAIVALIVFCFTAGLLLLTGPGDAVRAWLDRNMLERIPMLSIIRNLTERFVGIEGTQFTPAEADLFGSPARMLCFIVETLPDDRLVVFVPDVPTLTLGRIYVLPRSSITVLDATVAQVVNSITQWGTETTKIYEPSSGVPVTPVAENKEGDESG